MAPRGQNAKKCPLNNKNPKNAPWAVHGNFPNAENQNPNHRSPKEWTQARKNTQITENGSEKMSLGKLPPNYAPVEAGPLSTELVSVKTDGKKSTGSVSVKTDRKKSTELVSVKTGRKKSTGLVSVNAGQNPKNVPWAVREKVFSYSWFFGSLIHHPTTDRTHLKISVE